VELWLDDNRITTYPKGINILERNIKNLSMVIELGSSPRNGEKLIKISVFSKIESDQPLA